MICSLTTLHGQEPIKFSHITTAEMNTKLIPETYIDSFSPLKPDYFKIECYSDHHASPFETDSIQQIRSKEESYVNTKPEITTRLKPK